MMVSAGSTAASQLRALAAEGFGQVASVELRWISLPLLQPHVAAHSTEVQREVVLVRFVDTAGVEGWGECPALSTPGYSAEWTEGAWRLLGSELVPAVLDGGPVANARHPMASSAVEAAAIDLALRRQEVGFADVLGVTDVSVPRCTVLSDPGSVAGWVAAAQRAQAGGAAMVKLKVSPDMGVDAAAAVVQACPDLPVAVDANGSLAGSPDLVDRLAAIGVVYLEQPVPPGDPSVMAGVAARSGVCVAADESVADIGELTGLLGAHAGVVINIKAARMGGLCAAVDAVDITAAAGASGFVGGMLETGIGRAPAAVVAGYAAGVLGSRCLPTDVGPSVQYFAEDLTSGVQTTADGDLKVPGGVGLGFEVQPAAVDRHTVRTRVWVR